MIEKDMDLGLLLYRDEYYNCSIKGRSIMEIIIGKNRNSRTGTFKIKFDPSIGKLINFIV